MLVLNRKSRESIVIGDDVTVTVLKTAGNRVTLGIEAPDHVGVRRLEVTLADDDRSRGAVPSRSTSGVAVR